MIVLAWLNELEGACSEPRVLTLTSQLGSVLQGYMGIEREILTVAFLAEYRRKRTIKS